MFLTRGFNKDWSTRCNIHCWNNYSTLKITDCAISTQYFIYSISKVLFVVFVAKKSTKKTPKPTGSCWEDNRCLFMK